MTNTYDSNQSISKSSQIIQENIVPPSNFLHGEPTAKKISQSIDSNDPIVKDYIHRLHPYIPKKAKGWRKYKPVFDIWDNANNSWTYVGHPDNFTYYLKASEIIKEGFRGNCVNFAIVISASLELMGHHSRIVKAIGQNGIWHVYPELLMGTSQREAQPVIDYISKRYSTPRVHYHKEVNSKGKTEYWLNLDNWGKTPGGVLFDDNGAYHVFYPNGNFSWFRNSGYLENFPIFPSDNDAGKSSISKISYRAIQSNTFHAFPNETYKIRIICDNGGVNAFVFNQKDLETYQEFLKGLTPTITWRLFYVNIKNRTFAFTPDTEGDYYIVIANYPVTMDSADSQRELNVSIRIET